MGNLSGVLGPFMVGALKDYTGCHVPGLLAIGIGPIVSVAVVMLLMRPGAAMIAPVAAE